MERKKSSKHGILEVVAGGMGVMEMYGEEGEV